MDDKVKLSDFKIETRNLMLQRIRVAALLGIILFPLFGFLDYFVFPQFLKLFLILRFICAVVLCFCFGSTYTTWGKNRADLMAVIGFLTIGFTISIMVHVSGGHVSPYYVGLITIIVGLALLMPWGIREAFFVCAILYLSYLLPIVITEEITNVALFLNSNFFLLCTIIIALAATFFINRLRFQEFQARENLEKSYEELRITQNELIQSAKLATIGQLTAGINHEVKNPISYAWNSSETVGKYWNKLRPLLDKAVSEQEEIMREYPQIVEDFDTSLQIIRNGLDRTKNLVMDLNIFSRKDEGKFVEADIHTVIDSVLNLVNNEIKYHITVVKNYCPSGMVKCMPAQIGQVILNLLHNAAAAIPESQKGEIKITTQTLDGRFRISIQDSGPGIPPEIRDKLFQPFVTTKAPGTGTGLGLSISQRIIEAHGGKISVRSEPGQGAEFIIKLPLKGISPKE